MTFLKNSSRVYLKLGIFSPVFCFLLLYSLLGLNILFSQENNLRTNKQHFSTPIKESQDTLTTRRSFSNLERQSIHLMVVPNFSDYQQIKKKIEEDHNYKVVLNAISKALEDQGFTVKDFIESLKISEEKYQTKKEFFVDPFKVVLENAPADIFIYVDIYLETDDKDKQVSISLIAKDKYTADRYVTSPYLNSSKRHWKNFQKPALEALRLNNELDTFIFQLEKKLLLQVQYGRKIDLKIESEDPDSFSLEQPVNSHQVLSALILEWINQQAISHQTLGLYKGMLRVEINIPFLNKYNRIYAPNDFGLALQAFLKKSCSANNIPYKEVTLRVVGKRIELGFAMSLA